MICAPGCPGTYSFGSGPPSGSRRRSAGAGKNASPTSPPPERMPHNPWTPFTNGSPGPGSQPSEDPAGTPMRAFCALPNARTPASIGASSPTPSSRPLSWTRTTSLSTASPTTSLMALGTGLRHGAAAYVTNHRRNSATHRAPPELDARRRRCRRRVPRFRCTSDRVDVLARVIGHARAAPGRRPNVLRIRSARPRPATEPLENYPAGTRGHARSLVSIAW
jgi:hypothetical protein